MGALRAERSDLGWHVRYLGAPHIGDRSEAELIQDFADRIQASKPQLVSFNGGSFDMPVLRYRAMINRVAAPGLECRKYWYRYGDDALDLCDALACFSFGAKVSSHDLCRSLGFPGKPVDIDGSEVERAFNEGRITEIAGYCETDVVSTYRIWLVYELFRGMLTPTEFAASETNLVDYIKEFSEAKPHLTYLIDNFEKPEAGVELTSIQDICVRRDVPIKVAPQNKMS